MTISMHSATVPVFRRMLGNLAAILKKAEAHAVAKKFEPEVLLASRLAPDMFPLARQVQIASDAIKAGAARVAGVAPPSFEDNEKSLAELVARARKTAAFLETLKPAQFDGAEDRTVQWKTRSGEKSMRGLPYVLHQMLPNLHFHCTTAYDILRHNGVELGKMDYLGRQPLG